MNPRIGILGLSHLGLTTAISFASHSFPITAFDPDKELVQRLRNHQLPVVEPKMPELLKQFSKNIHFTADIKEINSCQILYIARDVPTNDRNESLVQSVRELISEAIANAANETTIVIHCQVHPGFTRNIGEEFKGIIAEKKLTLFYQVETLIFGDAINRCLTPERYMIGSLHPSEPLPPPYQTLLDSFSCPIFQMKYESAELAKIAINLFLVSSVTTTNTLAEICENIGADWSDVAETLRLDKRIGPHAYLQPGLGIAGGNLERDLVTVQSLSKQFGTDTRIVDAWISNSEYRKNWVMRVLHENVLGKYQKPEIAIWGLTYKPGTHSVKNSPSLKLIQNLRNYQLYLYDPVISRLETSEKLSCTHLEKPLQCCKKADALVIMTPWHEFRNMDIVQIEETLRGDCIIDPFGALQNQHHKLKRVCYVTLGHTMYEGVDKI